MTSKYSNFRNSFLKTVKLSKASLTIITIFCLLIFAISREVFDNFIFYIMICSILGFITSFVFHIFFSDFFDKEA